MVLIVHSLFCDWKPHFYFSVFYFSYIFERQLRNGNQSLRVGKRSRAHLLQVWLIRRVYFPYFKCISIFSKYRGQISRYYSIHPYHVYALLSIFKLLYLVLNAKTNWSHCELLFLTPWRQELVETLSHSSFPNKRGDGIFFFFLCQVFESGSFPVSIN